MPAHDLEWGAACSASREGSRSSRGASVRGLIAADGAPCGRRHLTSRRGKKIVAGRPVIDAAASDRVLRWLAAIGRARRGEARAVRHRLLHALLSLRGASEPPPNEHPAAADFNWVKYAVFPADDRTFSVTLAVPLAVPRLKVLAKVEAFDALVQALPAVAPWVAPEVAEPIGDPDRPVQAMGGLINRLRRFVVRGEPVALDFFALGDAAYCTNPLYGRGCAQAFLHADLLGQAIDADAGDLRAAARTLDRLGRAEIEPFYRASIIRRPRRGAPCRGARAAGPDGQDAAEGLRGRASRRDPAPTRSSSAPFCACSTCSTLRSAPSAGPTFSCARSGCCCAGAATTAATRCPIRQTATK